MIHYISKGNLISAGHHPHLLSCDRQNKRSRESPTKWILNKNASYVETVTFLFFQSKAKVNQEKKKVTLVISYTFGIQIKGVLCYYACAVFKMTS